MKNKVLIICINYNSDSDTLRLVDSVLNQSQSEKIKIIIADNSKEISSRLQKIGETQKNVIYLKNKENLGYFQGANLALKHYLKSNSLPNWIIISNPDIILKDSNFISKLLEIKERVIIAPSIISMKTNKDQNPFLLSKLSTKKVNFYKKVYSSNFSTKVYTFLHKLKSRFLRNKKETRRKIYAPHGSFIIIPKEYLKNKSSLNYKGFLFGEEIFLAEEAKKANIEIIYNPNLKVFHKQNVSISKLKNPEYHLKSSLLKNLKLLNETK